MDDPVKHPEVAAIFTRLLTELRLSGNQLARALNTSQQVISGYASGRTNPGREMIAAIIARYPAISAAWLVTGIGEPFPAGRFNEKPAPRAAEPAADYTTGAGTIDATVNLLLKEQLSEARERAAADRALIAWLQGELGKSPGSSDAAGPLYAPAPAPAPTVGFRLSVQRRASQPGMQAGR